MKMTMMVKNEKEIQDWDGKSSNDMKEQEDHCDHCDQYDSASSACYQSRDRQ